MNSLFIPLVPVKKAVCSFGEKIPGVHGPFYLKIRGQIQNLGDLKADLGLAKGDDLIAAYALFVKP